MEDKRQDFESGSEAKWKCGDPYQHPIPPVEGNPWEKLLLPLLERDTAQCDAWKDEVQNLLIFAGLFSGVITTFVLQSYQSLQPDPNDAIINLLSQIASRVDNPVNGTSPPDIPTNSMPLSSAPNASLIRINVFWFISLVLSLTTVLVGIVSLQWLREHQQYANITSPKAKLGIFNMRAEALKVWRVPQIFAFLPILLQFSLSLFLVGLPDFLLPLGPKVAVPVIIAIGIPLTFLVITTTLPALQAFTLFLPFPHDTTTVASQCPYKSPQSLIFQRLVWTSRTIAEGYLVVMIILYSSIIVFPRKLLRFDSRSGVGQTDCPTQDYHYYERRGYRTIMLLISQSLKLSKWGKCDLRWLLVRDFYAASISSQYSRMMSDAMIGLHDQLQDCDSMSPAMEKDLRQVLDTVEPIFDVTQALRKAWNGDSQCHSTAYWAFHELTPFLIRFQDYGEIPEFKCLLRANQLLQQFIGYQDNLGEVLSTYSSLLAEKEINQSMLVDENAFLFISNCSRTTPEVGSHFAELHIRLSHYLYTKKPRTLGDQVSEMPRSHFVLLRDRSFEAKNWWCPMPSSDNGFSIQCSDIMKSFFQAAISPDISDDDFLNSFHAQEFSGLLRCAMLLQSKDHIDDLLIMISTSFNTYLDQRGMSKRTDFLLYASIFCTRLSLSREPQRNLISDGPEVMEALPVIKRYREMSKEIKGAPDCDLGERLHMSEIGKEWWWEFPRENEEDKTEDAAPPDRTTNAPSHINHQDNTNEEMGASAENWV